MRLRTSAEASPATLLAVVLGLVSESCDGVSVTTSDFVAQYDWVLDTVYSGVSWWLWTIRKLASSRVKYKGRGFSVAGTRYATRGPGWEEENQTYRWRVHRNRRDRVIVRVSHRRVCLRRRLIACRRHFFVSQRVRSASCPV